MVSGECAGSGNANGKDSEGRKSNKNNWQRAGDLKRSRDVHSNPAGFVIIIWILAPGGLSGNDRHVMEGRSGDGQAFHLTWLKYGQ